MQINIRARVNFGSDRLFRKSHLSKVLHNNVIHYHRPKVKNSLQSMTSQLIQLTTVEVGDLRHRENSRGRRRSCLLECYVRYLIEVVGMWYHIWGGETELCTVCLYTKHPRTMAKKGIIYCIRVKIEHGTFKVFLTNIWTPLQHL